MYGCVTLFAFGLVLWFTVIVCFRLFFGCVRLVLNVIVLLLLGAFRCVSLFDALWFLCIWFGECYWFEFELVLRLVDVLISVMFTCSLLVCLRVRLFVGLLLLSFFVLLLLVVWVVDGVVNSVVWCYGYILCWFGVWV